MAAPSICTDVVFTLDGEGVLASNHRARTHVWLSPALFDALAGRKAAGPLAAADRTRFTSADGLLADPTGLDRAPGDRKAFASLEEALPLLRKRFVVVEDAAAYRAYFAPKSSLIDAKHSGTFHQQLGAELRLRRRVDPNVWWYAQKFDPDTGKVRDNLYKFVQERFLERYLPTLRVEGKTVLDFGCGSGMASRRFKSLGARRVIGVDPDPVLLGRARENVGEGFVPVRMDLAAAEPLAGLPDEPVDLVWLADVFMFYFHPQDAGKPLMPPGELLRRLTRRLAPGGRCVVMQPHGVFWLLPWLGDPANPYTVMSEYADKVYSVAPSLEALSAAFADAGLAIARVHEPKAEGGPADDPMAAAVARRFPQWWVFETLKAAP